MKHQIQSGKVPLIIDGFDELLRSDIEDKVYDDAEPMLHTIGELLTKEAKVLLTTRRTAVFAGDDFHLWIEENENSFEFARFRIEKPTMTDWLGSERISKLSENGLRINDFSNPVLLAFLRSANSTLKCNSPVGKKGKLR